ncbi:MAG: ribosomal RNA small subunit methyltransferase A [Planctomycetes bacterium]|nr:ribosomal RNA small subunit methyltransferase A [Planctomycetota bacterium]
MSDDSTHPGRDAFARYRERLDAVGFKPSSARGQNFLLDPSLHRWIADQAAPGPDDTVVEIGVGLGFLTRELAARAGAVLAVEIEQRLCDIARGELVAAGNIEWLLGDALGGPGRSLLPRIGEVCEAARGRVLVVANLPYSVSGPLLAELAQLPRLPDGIVVLVQKELGQRLAAGVGHADYGGLGVLLQNLFDVRSLRDVSPEVFRPRPKVWSSVVALRRLETLPGDLGHGEARRSFARFVRALFGQRRKVLRTTAAAAAREIGCAAPDLPPDLAGMRAEQLSPQQVRELWSATANR